MFLMPSLFEPCGLSQMMSLRYGTIPIVRETGGLKDSVQPFNEFDGTGTEFSFANYNAHEMMDIIDYALHISSVFSFTFKIPFCTSSLSANSLTLSNKLIIIIS